MGMGLSVCLGILLSVQQPTGDEPDPAQRPQRVDAPITAVHTPSGLDDNDVAQIMIEGEFPNSCYAIGRATVRARTEDLEQGIIQFHLEALKYERPKCLAVRTPFLKTVDLGILPSGTYQILQIKDLAKKGVLNIHKAHRDPDDESSTSDDNTYAPVDAVFVKEDALGFRRLIVLVGSFTNTCMKFAESFPVYRGPNSRVVEVLPVVTMERDQRCLDQMVPFFHTVEVPDDVPNGRYVIHVRTMNGNSINKLDTLTME